MKKFFKVIMIMLVIALVTGSGYADVFGVKAGLNRSSMTDMNAKNGIVAGIFYQIDISKSISLQPEVLYSKGGAINSATVSLYGFPLYLEHDYSFDYIHVPILLKLKAYNGKSAALSFFIGPRVSLKSKAKIDETWRYLSLEEEKTHSVTGIKSVNFGIAAGTEVSFNIGNQSIIIDLRYSTDISEIAADTGTKNSSFSVMVGYGFGK